MRSLIVRKVGLSVIATALVAFVLLYVAIDLANGFGVLVPPGATFVLRSGVVQSVTPGSPAARAGVRAGDRADFTRGGWLLHLSLDRAYLFVGRPSALPLIRNGHAITAVLRVLKPTPRSDAWANFVAAALLLLYSGLGAALYFMRRTMTCLVFFALACGQAIQFDNLAPMRIATPGWMPLAILVATLGPYLGQYGLLYFGLLFSNRSIANSRRAQFAVAAVALALAAVYYYHFYAYTVLPDVLNSFLVVSILNWLMFAAAAGAISARISHDADSRRLRWVAVGIWAQALVFAVFYIDENLHQSTVAATPAITYLFAWFQPAPLGIAYVLMHTRVIDVRVVGARTIVYGLLTAIPIGLFSIADWFFSRRLADARLATFAEFGIAVLFGIWLNTLHKRIDRFVERIVFASRHHAFQRLRHAMHALSSVEHSPTATAMMCEEAASALHLASAAVFMSRGDAYDRVTHLGWEGCAEHLSADDPLVLFARSAHHTTRLSEVAPTHSAIPPGDGKPEIAVPVMQHHRIIAVAFYGRHANGEHLDADEEMLLSELAQAAGAALDRLQLSERVRELELAAAFQSHVSS